MRPPTSFALERVLRFALVALCAGLPGFLAFGSGCYVHADDDDEFCDDDDFDDDGGFDDDDCDDDDGSVIVVFGQMQESYRLETYRIEVSGDSDHHPIARVADVEGVSIQSLLGPGVYDAQAFRAVSDRILSANDDLLGLPAPAGRRRFVGTAFGANEIAVSYAQESDALGSWRDVPGAGTILHFELSGALASIENRIALAPLASPASIDPIDPGASASSRR